MYQKLKTKVTRSITNYKLGFEIIFLMKKLLKRLPQPDYDFPISIHLEVSSLCNLSCIHCPPQMVELKALQRKYEHMDIALFDKCMDEIDQWGDRHLGLHEDGEPLLHPKIIYILDRVKRNNNHIVYLTTNAHRLDEEISNSIIKNKIDIINFSIGAYSAEFYEKVRGKGFDKVLKNIHSFLDLCKKSNWKTRIKMQIIDLPEFEEMQNEIINFKKYWKRYDVELDIWKKLTWSVLDGKQSPVRRYPCFSLWQYLFVNSNGVVSPCCVDWRHELAIGNAYEKSLKDIWLDQPLKNLRQYHIEGREKEIPLCKNCNYWSWLPKINTYRL